MTVIGELLHLKKHRENKAELAVSAARIALADATRRRDEARDEVERYRGWAVDTERRWYAALCREIVRVQRIFVVMEDVAVLRRKERDLDVAAEDRERARQTSETRLNEARSEHSVATRVREKFEQLADIEADELRLEGERKEDVEVDDLYAIRKERDEWGGDENA